MKNQSLFKISVNFLIVAIGLSLCCTHSQAAITPVSLGVVPPVQFPPSDFTITGVRLSAGWGQHRNVYGIDLGVLGNRTDQDFVGLAIAGGMNWTEGQTRILGLQLAGVTNLNQQKTNVYGVQAAVGANVMTAASSVVGLQIAAANISDHTDIYGIQAGVHNRALNVYGFQIGLVNITDNLHGVQIGVINFHRRGLISVAPVINIGF